MALFGGSRPKVDWSRVGTFLARGMDGLDQRRTEEQARIARDRYRSDIAPHDGPNGSGTGAAKTREEMLAALMQASANGLDVSRDARLFELMNPDPQYFNTSQGIYGVQGGKATPVLQIAPKPDLPPGWRVTPGGQWEPIPGGPADPSYVRRLSDERREAISTRPMPRAARSAGGGGGSRGPSRPAATAPARRPWENYR